MNSTEIDKAFLKILHLLSMRYSQSYLKREIIFNEGDIGQNIYFILSGGVHIFSDQGEFKHTLCHLTEGDVFGEMAILNDLPRTASVESDPDCQLVVLNRETFFSLVEKYPILSLKMLRLMAERMRVMDSQIKEELGYSSSTSV